MSKNSSVEQDLQDFTRGFGRKFRTPYVHYDTSIFWIDQSEEASLTQQHLKEDVDINEIVKRYQLSGYLPQPEEGKGEFLDCSDFVDFQESLERFNYVNDYFKSLPSSTRTRFSNSPVEMVSFLEDPANRDEAVKLGLLQEDVPEAPVEVVVKGGLEMPPVNSSPSSTGGEKEEK